MVKADNHVSLRTVLETARDQFNNVACIYAEPVQSTSDPTYIIIKIHTEEARSLEQYLDLFDSDTRILLEEDDGSSWSLQFEVMATLDGPGGLGGVTVYMDDSGIGAESVTFDEGLRNLEQLLKMNTRTRVREGLEGGFVAIHPDTNERYEGPTPLECLRLVREESDGDV